MTQEADKLKRRYSGESNPAERKKIREDLDQMPLSGSELAQVKQREHDRKQNDIKEFNEQRNR